MPRRKISFDVEVNTPSAQREASRLANIFQQRLRNVQVGTTAGRGTAGGGGGGGGGGGATSGMPGSSLSNLIFGSAQFALAGHFYKFFSTLPQNIAMLDQLATSNKRAAASFVTVAGGVQQANDMIDAFIQGGGNVASRVEATTGAMRLFNIGMADNAQEMRIFTTLSRGMSQALGRDVGYIQEQLSLALANQSLLRFDQLGLSVQRHQELVAELSRTYPELSTEMIFQNALIVQATEKYYNLATAQEALATNTEIVSREIKDNTSILAEWVSTRLMQPLAGDLAKMLGADDLTLDVATLKNIGRRERGIASFKESISDPGQMMRDMLQSVFRPTPNPRDQQGGFSSPEQNRINASVADALANALNVAQSSINMDVEPPKEFVAFLREVTQSLLEGEPAAAEWVGRINAMAILMGDAANAVDPLAGGLLNLTDAAKQAAATIEDVTGQLMGTAEAMVTKLINEGMQANEAIEMVKSSKEIGEMAKTWVDAGGFSGDPIADAAAVAVMNKTITEAGDEWIEASREAESAGKRAASALESAAKKAEKAFVDAADKIRSTFSDMLHSIEGVFGTSEVTEDDLKLAEAGGSVNYADDYLRRVRDVAFNKKARTDVDMGLVRAALGLPEDTSDIVSAIKFGRAWETGALWANPENIANFMNVGAVKEGLHNKELGALGTQNLEAFFGIGTEQGQEFLKIFGVEALDPIEDGLITEITTRGPIMGEFLANAMNDGFTSAALRLPWIQSIMNAIDSEVGRRVAEGMNGNSASDLAAAEEVIP